MSVSSTLVTRFNRAAAIARAGNHQSAIDDYARLLTDSLPEGERYEATPQFVATIELRRAWCLMDLERYRDARAVLEGQRARQPRAVRRDERCDGRAFTEALELDDEERFVRAWNWRETWRAVYEATTHALCSA